MIYSLQSTTIWETFLFVFGGLGIFLYGINLMGDSLKDLAGDKLKMIIEKSTNTPLKGILVGALLTAVLQSSSGTTALTVGLVRAGLMSLPQAIGIIMGANIGTTITSFIVGLNIAEYSLIFIGLGAILIFFINGRKIKDLGKVICGFGMLFFGLQLIDSGLDFIIVEYNAQITSLFETFGKFPILGLFTGTLITAVVQSSSATIAILQSIFQTGKITLLGALPILIGCNIGTTVTAVIAAVGGNTESKRTAVVHATFNIFGAVLFMIILRFGFTPLMTLIDNALGGSSKMTIAFAHMIFNATTTFVLFFFVKWMVKFAYFVIKDDKTKEEVESKLLEELLDYSLIKKSTALALSFVSKCMDHMGTLVTEFYVLATNYSKENNEESFVKGQELEEKIDSFDKRIHDYLINLTLENVHPNESHLISQYLDTIKDYERIGDHCSNIMDFFKDRYERKLELSLDSMQDLEQMFSKVDTMVVNATEALTTWDVDKANIVEETERTVDQLQETLHERHNHRMSVGSCSYDNSDYYVELLANLERIGDHCKNVADTVLHKNRASF